MFRPLIFTVGVLALSVSPGLQAQDKAKLDAELEKMTKDLRHRDVKVRVAAVKALGEKGVDAGPAARSLCDALLDQSPQVAVAALEALEKVRPDLYKHVSTMVLDKDRQKQMTAIQELGLLGEKANPVITVLLARLRTELATRNVKGLHARGLSEFETAYFSAIRQIKPDDSETIKLYKVMAGATNQDGYARLEAILFLSDWAAEEEARRKELLPLLKSGLDNPVCQVPCIKLCGTYGALAKDFVPLLKKLKLSNNENVRMAASTALDQIENP